MLQSRSQGKCQRDRLSERPKSLCTSCLIFKRNKLFRLCCHFEESSCPNLCQDLATYKLCYDTLVLCLPARHSYSYQPVRYLPNFEEVQAVQVTDSVLGINPPCASLQHHSSGKRPCGMKGTQQALTAPRYYAAHLLMASPASMSSPCKDSRLAERLQWSAQ
eukprot:GHUV01041854.1.p1 GENE.GHUV01041854.1~~GHUV01041854.1.p1  ORF type:complete len:162 (+),score=8.74 GHUV01041854.1:428-913(+)